MNCHEWKPLLSGYVDRELMPDEEQRLTDHLSHCRECRSDLQELRDIEGVTAAMRDESSAPGSPVDDVFWDRYWMSVYNRLERGVGWILLSAGASVLAVFAAWHFATGFLLDPSAPLMVRLGVGLAVAGLVVLGMSLVRERARSYRHDPYKEVKR